VRKIIAILVLIIVVRAGWMIYQKLAPPPDVRAAMSDLRSRDAQTRWNAADRLGHMGAKAKPAIPALVAALNDTDDNGSSAFAAANALGSLGTVANAAVPALVEKVQHGKENVPVVCARALIQIQPEGLQALLKLAHAGQAGQTIIHAMESFGQQSVPMLSEWLKDDDEKLRLIAVTALGRIRWEGVTDEQIDKLQLALSDKSDAVRIAAIVELSQLGPLAAPALPALKAALDEGHPSVTVNLASMLPVVEPRETENAIEALVKIVEHAEGKSDGSHIPSGNEASADQDHADQSAAIAALGTFGPDATEALAKLLDPSHPKWMRIAAAEALAELGRSAFAAVPALAKQLEAKDADVRLAAVKSLGAIGTPAAAAVPEVLKFLASGNQAERCAAVETLGRIGKTDPEPVLKTLVPLVRSADDALQMAAINAMAEIGPAAAPAAGELFRLYGEYRNTQLGAATITAIGKTGATDKAAVQQLIAILTADDQETVHSAVEALGQMGALAADAAPALVTVMAKDDGYNSTVACDALTKLGEAGAIELGKMVNVSEPGVSSRAVDALAKMKAAAKPAIPNLVAALQNGNPLVVTSAVKVLSGFGPDAAEAVPEIIKHLGDDDFRNALVAIGPPAVPLLRATLSTGGTDEQLGAAVVLGEIKPAEPKTIQALAAVVRKSADERLRGYAAVSLGNLGADSRQAIAALQAAQSDPSESLCLVAAAVLAKLDPETRAKSFQEINQLLHLPNELAQEIALQILRDMGSAAQPVAAEILKLLDDDQIEVRLCAAEALVQIDANSTKVVLPLLLKFLQSGDPGTRDRAAKALGQIRPTTAEIVHALERAVAKEDYLGTPAACPVLGEMSDRADEIVPFLLAALRMNNSEERIVAIEALGELRSKSAIPVLMSLIDDPTPETSAAAAAALKKIDPELAKRAAVP
jgi:HEAT repeat protein